MKRLLVACIAAFVAACAVAPLVAQGTLDKRISVTFEDVAPKALFEAIASTMGVRLVIAPEVTSRVTIDLRDIRIETALNAVCDSIACKWRLLEGNTLYVGYDAAAAELRKSRLAGAKGIHIRDVSDKLPAQILWDRAPAEPVFQSLARMLDAGLSIDPTLADVQTSLSVTKNTTMEATLDAVCAQVRCRWTFTAGADRLLSVVPADSALALEKNARMLRVRRVDELKRALQVAQPCALEQAAATLDALLDCAGRYVAAFKKQFPSVVAEEQRVQGVLEHLQWAIRSELVLLDDPNAQGWLEFRDAFEADGRAVGGKDPHRLSALLLKPTEEALTAAARFTRASRDVMESRRPQEGLYIPQRTTFFERLAPFVQTPISSLSILSLSNQGAFAFSLAGQERIGEVLTRKVEYRRVTWPENMGISRPRLAGTFWIHPRTGAVVRASLEAVEGPGGAGGRAATERILRTVDYGPIVAGSVLVPASMSEEYLLQATVSSEMWDGRRLPQENRTRTGGYRDVATVTYANFRPLGSANQPAASGVLSEQDIQEAIDWGLGRTAGRPDPVPYVLERYPDEVSATPGAVGSLRVRQRAAVLTPYVRIAMAARAAADARRAFSRADVTGEMLDPLVWVAAFGFSPSTNTVSRNLLDVWKRPMGGRIGDLFVAPGSGEMRFVLDKSADGAIRPVWQKPDLTYIAATLGTKVNAGGALAAFPRDALQPGVDLVVLFEQTPHIPTEPATPAQPVGLRVPIREADVASWR